MKKISWIEQVKKRWKAETPKFFKKIVWSAASVSGVAIAVNAALSMAGATAPSWWIEIYPYLVGVPAGMAAVAKLTKENSERK